MSRMKVLWGGSFVLLLLVVGHVMFWYLPKSSAKTLDDGDAALHYLERTEAVRVWIPRPHQNLGRFDEWLGGLEAYLATWSEVAEQRAPELPRFGPFRVPPSRALSIAYEPRSGALSVVAEVYPAMVALARSAGALTSNRWLQAGEFTDGGQLNRVSWDGFSWRLERQGRVNTAPRRAAPTPPEHGDQELFVALTLAAPLSGLPKGSYSLRKHSDPAFGWSFETTGGATEGFWRRTSGHQLPPVFVASGKAYANRGAGGLVLFGTDVEKGTLKLPGSAAFMLEEDSGWQLPGHQTLSTLRWNPRKARQGRWMIRALDRSSLRAVDERPEVIQTLDQAVVAEADLVARVDLGTARSYLAALVTALPRVPVVGKRQARPWQRVEKLVAPFEEFDLLEVEMAKGNAVVRLLPGSLGAGASEEPSND